MARRTTKIRRVWRERAVAELPQVARIVVAASVSWAISEPLVGSPYSPQVYAVIVPLVAMRDHPFSALNVSVDRLAGVLAGIFIGIGVASWLGVTLPAIALVLAAGLLIGVAAHFGSSLNVQVAVSGLLVFTSTNPDTYALSRLWETGIGAAVTVVLSPLLLPPNARRHFQILLAQVRSDLARLVVECAAVARGGQIAELSTEEWRLAAHDVEGRAIGLPAAFEHAMHAVRRNPVRRQDVARLERLRGAVGTTAQLGPLTARLVEDVLDFSGRTSSHWEALRGPIPDVLDGLSSLMQSGLADEVSTSAAPVRVNEAVDRFRTWRDRDARPAAAVLRRPVGLMLIALGADPMSVRARAEADPSEHMTPVKGRPGPVDR